MKTIAQIFIAAWLIISGMAGFAQQSVPQANNNLLGIYIHQHWSYNNPYAARTWTLANWRGYIDGISRLGYNSILIWPVLETMPEPLTPSDEANLKKIAEVIEMAHHDFNMRVSIVLCPNVAPKSEEGRKYTFEKRPFFHTDDRVDPGDPVAFGKLMEWREKIFAPLKNADGLFIIDSDPGGYPHSTSMEFVYLLGAHRRMLDRLRPGIEISYWAGFGWESYGRFYSTGELKPGEPAEFHETISLISKQRMEPWAVASGRGPDIADAIDMSDRVLAFNYGAIENEPSFPFTLYGGEKAYMGGQNGGSRGVLGNSQTHTVQLPNTFAFARGAKGLAIRRTDYIHFADELIPGQGKLIVEGWEALQGSDASGMQAVISRLAALKSNELKAGPLKGLLFGDPQRFVNDLILQLQMAATMYNFRTAVMSGKKNPATVKKTLSAFTEAAAAWQQKHGYSNHWYWPPMIEALRKLESPQLNATLNTLRWVSDQGATPFDRVKNGLAQLEDYTPRLLASMKQAIEELNTKNTK